MSDAPAVTIVVPTRNRSALLAETLASLLDHDYTGDLTVLVVFDQSTPDPGLVLDRPGRRVRAIANSRTPGAAGARNTGILAARTELVALCDDTDLWLPGKLNAQVPLFDDPATELVGCGLRLFTEDTRFDRAVASTRVSEANLLNGHLPALHPSGFVLRRSAAVDGFGLFSEDIPGSYGEDYEFLLRAAASSPVRNLPTIGVAIRMHKESYFSAADNGPVIAEAGRWLLDRYPFPRAGYAHWAGKVAFAEAVSGARGAAVRWAGRTMLRRPYDPRAALALAVATGVPPRFVLRQLDRMGRGL
ncbi:glycosyltransferase family 2 protein [Actinomadura craniellae]|uniref:Glycosyltransferase family 2 protein n=1 Tax=Actinomadura craniellae TaxID=2231787 RepID=A0A365GZT4_9ACTN|nr:glycosyltransferase family 2 protein [Actinomadura craniellae]RAY12331.1 glycosyltransferase family 2 protein [Actinomadura craniellae]